jgi:hypothetical protein
MVDIGGGVMMRDADLAQIKILSSTATKFARNMMRILFSQEELQGRSLFGRGSNANKTKPGPVLDITKRNALISTSNYKSSTLFPT